jgi:vacuolar ATPase assembly integral membrane protein VMA21
MATRRIVSTSGEPTVLDKDDNLPPAKAIAGKGNTTPAVSAYAKDSALRLWKLMRRRDTIIKLLAFTAAMIIAPIGTYYGTMATIFKGNCALKLPCQV